jgi:RimJ/RimL family protein N-acetyltransferase
VRLLDAWFKEPHVQKWWPVPDKEENILEHFLPRIRSKDACGFIVYKDSMPLGYVQYYPIDRKNPKTGAWLPIEVTAQITLGIDQFIGDCSLLGKGLGTQFLKEFISYLAQNHASVAAIIVDPDSDNHAAIRCYEKVGFKKMGTYQAPWGPALLMRYTIDARFSY